MYAVYLKPSGQSNTETHLRSNHNICVAFGTGVIVLVDYQTGQKVMVDSALKQSINTYELN